LSGPSPGAREPEPGRARALGALDRPEREAERRPGHSPAGLSPRPTGRAVQSAATRVAAMCRNIRNLYNFEPPATDEEIRASALQYVRKISGFAKPSQVNEEAFSRAVDAVTAASTELLSQLQTSAPPKDREVEAAKARARAAQRYAA